MTLPHFLIASPLVHRLGWTLLHSLWEGAIVAALLSMLLRQLRSRRPEARYGVSVGALLFFAAGVLATFIVVPVSSNVSRDASRQIVAVAAENSRLGPDVARGGARRLPPAEYEARLIEASEQRPHPIPASGSTAIERNPALTSNAAPAGAGPSNWTEFPRMAAERLAGALPWIVLAWAAGVLYLSAWNVGGWVAARRLGSLAVGPVTDEVRDAVHRLSRRLGRKRPPEIRQSWRIASPLVIGAFKPVILIPASLLTGVSPAYLEPLLAHELAHVIRHDYVMNLLLKGLEILLFYHPATWWIGRKIRIEREHCCDDIAVATIQDRRTYVLALAALAECQVPMHAAAATGAPLVGRIRRLVGAPDPESVDHRARHAGLGALATAAMVMIVALAAFAQSQNTAAGPTDVPPQTQLGASPADGPSKASAAGERFLAPGWLTGRVMDPDGRPFAGALVRVEPSDDGDGKGGLPVATAITGADGRFRLGPLPASYQSRNAVAVDADGFATFRIPPKSYSVYAAADCDLGPIHLERGRSFRGQVLDVDGKPVARQTIECAVLKRVEGYGIDEVIPARKLVTDDEGRFSTPPLPVGILSIDVRVPDRRLGGWFQPIRPGAGEEELPPCHLQSDIAIRGVMKDEQGRPISGVSLDSNGFKAVSGTDGKFILGGFWPGERFQVEIRKPGMVPETRLVKMSDHDFRYGGRIYEDGLPDEKVYTNGPATELNVVMHSAAWIDARAVDAVTGEPVQVSRVVLCNFERKPNGEIVLSTCRSPEFEQSRKGQFRVSYYAPAEYHLTVAAIGYDDAEAFTPPVKKLEPISGIVVKMKKQAGPAPRPVATQKLTGLVTRHGKPVKTGWVALWRTSRQKQVLDAYLMRGRTSEGAAITYSTARIRGGAYSLDVPYQDGGWYLVIDEPGQPLTQVGPISIAADETRKLDVACTDGGSISGHVAHVPAEWAGHLWVVAFTRSGIRAECQVGADGHFILASLPPGEYGLKAGNDSMRDSEILDPPLPRAQWDRPANPWRRAVTVQVSANHRSSGVDLEFPAP